MRKIFRVGSRDSVLAVKQTQLVIDAIARAHPQVEIELITMKTSGDLNLRPFDQWAQRKGAEANRFGAKGLFVKELEQALLEERIDLAVHSLKDMPMEQDERLPILAFFKRGDPRDALVSPLGRPRIDEKDIGCSSARRRAQLAKLMPGRGVRSIRGNVLTRLKKLDEGQYGFLVLAAVGLQRLGLESRISRFFSPEEMVPAAGQGSLACQGRKGDRDFIDAVNDPDTEACARAERAFVARLGGGCSMPVAAYAKVWGTELKLIGFYADETERFCHTGSLSGNREDAVGLGETLAQRIRECEIFER